MTEKLLNYDFDKKKVENWEEVHDKILQKITKERAQIFENNLCWLYATIKNPDTAYINELLQLCYKVSVKKQQLERVDNLNIVTGQNFLGKELTEKTRVEIMGHFCSRNVIDQEGKNHVKLFVYDRQHKIIQENLEDKLFITNFIYLDGYICKKPFFKITSLNKEITELLIAVNRTKRGKTDYIPCITWAKNAHRAMQLKVGDRIKIYGFVQSRKYGGGCYEAYEVSVQHFLKVE